MILPLPYTQSVEASEVPLAVPWAHLTWHGTKSWNFSERCFLGRRLLSLLLHLQELPGPWIAATFVCCLTTAQDLRKVTENINPKVKGMNVFRPKDLWVFILLFQARSGRQPENQEQPENIWSHVTLCVLCPHSMMFSGYWREVSLLSTQGTTWNQG